MGRLYSRYVHVLFSEYTYTPRLLSTNAPSSLYLPVPLLHQFTFAGLMCLNALIVFGLLTHANLKIPLSSNSSKLISPIDKTQVETPGKVAFRTLASGLLIFNTGFAIWIADNIFCDSLGSLRDWAAGKDAGLMGVVTQGHAWWHLLTGLGANWLIVGLTCKLVSRASCAAF